MDDDMPDWKDDVEKFKRIRKKGNGSLSITKKMEYGFWTLAVLAVLAMLVSMVYPGVGPNEPISGMQWLGGSIGGMIVFGGIALVLRQLPEVGE